MYCVLTPLIFKGINDHFLSISTLPFSTDYVTASSAIIAIPQFPYLHVSKEENKERLSCKVLPLITSLLFSHLTGPPELGVIMSCLL